MHTIELTDEELEVIRRALKDSAYGHYLTPHILDKLKPQTYSIGQIFKRGVGENTREYILAEVGTDHNLDDRVALINLANGRKWAPSNPVDNVYEITPQEFKLITNYSSGFVEE